MSDRLVLRPGSARGAAAAFARRFDWPLVEDIARDTDQGVDGLCEWEAPEPLRSFFFCEDADFGLPYVAVSGIDREAVDTVVAEIRRTLRPWTLPELCTAADTASGADTALAESMLLIGLAVPNDHTAEVFERLLAGMRHADEKVRWAAIWATTYTGYDAFIPALRTAADTDATPWVRARAATVLDVFEEMRGEPPYSA